MPESIDWSLLADSIAAGYTVLVLGPDAIPVYCGDKSSTFGALRDDAIMSTLDEQELLHFYARDHLFQFANFEAKDKAIRTLHKLARDTSWVPDSELLRQIVAMPFSVVINLNPDRYLYNAYVQYWNAPQFDYFSTYFKPNPPKIEYPDSYEKPLLYNLGGSILDARDSVVLDYQDMFAMFKHLLNDTGVPENLWQKLQKANQFILLGFELERWYTQLLIHYINRRETDVIENRNRNFPILCEVSEDSKTFVMQQLNIKHLSLTRKDFQKIYEACAQDQTLRQLHASTTGSANQIRGMVLQNRFEEAFTALTKLADEGERELDLPLLHSAYNQYREDQRQRTADARDLEVRINRIRYALLTYANKLGKV